MRIFIVITIKTMVKLFINLDEVKSENGPLEILTKKNTKK